MERNKTADLFERAYKEIMLSDEIDKIINTTKGSEKRHLKRLKKMNISKDDIVPIWSLLHVIESKSLLKDIITYMVVLSAEEE